MYLIRIDHHNGLMSRETTFPIPESRTFHEVHGLGRVVGFLVREWSRPLRAVVIHLDCPGFTLEYEVPPAYTESGVDVSNPPFLRPCIAWHNVII